MRFTDCTFSEAMMCNFYFYKSDYISRNVLLQFLTWDGHVVHTFQFSNAVGISLCSLTCLGISLKSPWIQEHSKLSEWTFKNTVLSLGNLCSGSERHVCAVHAVPALVLIL